jgi:crossover junction endodeoxyribonuclease RuvC
MQNQTKNRMIGIDPGYDRIGVAILEGTASSPILVYSTCIVTDRKQTFPERLEMAFLEVEKIIEQYKPDKLAIEDLFLNTNQKTAIKVAEARGVFLLLGQLNNLEIFEYTPLQIKNSVTGYGRAEKSQVDFIVRKILKLEKEKKIDDEMDAIAICLTHMYNSRINRIAK